MTKKPGSRGGPDRRNITPSGDGRWAVNEPGKDKPTSIHSTQEKAIDRGRDDLRRAGGGELTIHGRDGKIRDSDTVAPGRDPSPPKDKK